MGTVVNFIRKIKEGIMGDLTMELKKIKPHIPEQTYRTIVGQIRSGDMGGATVGIYRIKKRIEKEAMKYENCRC